MVHSGQTGESARRRVALISIVAIVVLGGAGIGAAVAIDRGARSSDPHVTGEQLDRPVPPLRLRDEHGKATTLAAFRGKVVVLTPFLTLCHEVCPLTTGAFEQLQRIVNRAGLGGRVAFAEVSVDPWRDTPARLRAFARLTGVRFHLYTGSASQLARFWHFFGVAYWRTKEDSPPDIDWLTHKPLTFDVSHTDGLFLLDARGHERILDVGMPATGPRLPQRLFRLLNAEGRRELAHPQAPWTIRQALDDIAYLLGRRIPAADVDA